MRLDGLQSSNETKIRLDNLYTPRGYQRAVFDAIENRGYKKAILCWPRRCLHGDTHITMSDGSFRLLKDLNVGDSILSWNGTTFEPDMVANIWETEPKKTIKIRTSWPDGYIITSYDHKFLRYNTFTCKLRWTKARYLKYGDKLFTNYRSCRLLEHGIEYITIKTIEDGPTCELFDIETTKNHNFIANGYVVHNSGKDTTLWHLILRQALRRVGVYMYCLPTYSQAKSVIWQSIRTDGLKLVDMIPEELIFKKNESNMSIELINGSLIKLIGSDSYNTSLRGSNPMGIVFSEYAQADPDAFRASLPIIQANNGWVVIQSTPWGHNSFFDICQIAENSPEEWFYQKLTINDTGHISEDDVENLILTNQISREFANQEYYTSFDTGVEGSYYAKYLMKMNLNNQITDVPYEAAYPVHTAWDLGYSDMCVILFYQICNRTVHIFDMIEDNKKGLDHYCKDIMAREYQYGIHVAPHDIAVTEFGSGLTRIDIARRLGIDFTICPKRSIMDGIECVRANLSRIWIDRTRCKRLVSALENYSQEWDNKMKVYKERPNHDSYSHVADALRYLCSSIDISSRQTTPEQLNERFIKAKSQSNYVETGPFARKY